MTTLILILVMLVAVLLSGVLVRILPFSIPLPLMQIGFGFLIAASFERGIELEPEVFFLLFLPPLLFLDGWRIPKNGLFQNKMGVFQLAFGLVFLTVFCLGYLLHWIIPSMPLTVAFALAAIVSPTDPVAVSAIMRRVVVPRRIMILLESESLFNDASGLVAFRFAVVATVTGVFSLTSAVTSFVWLAVAGLATGVVVTLSVSYVRSVFVSRHGEESGSEVLLSLLLPFMAYYLAEQIGASGILSAVAAGVTMSYSEMSGRALAQTRVHRHVVWSSIQFILTGLMFVLLGEQLPGIMQGAAEVLKQVGHHHWIWLAVYPIVTCLALIAIRFSWIFITAQVGRFVRPKRDENIRDMDLRMMAVLSLAGVRGTITLAGVMTLPLVVQDGTAFPARDLAIFLAAMVIIFSLIIASVALPFLLRNVATSDEANEAEQLALLKEAARKAAIKSVGQTLARHAQADSALVEVYTSVAGRMMDELKGPLEVNEAAGPNGSAARAEVEREIRLYALRASRQAIYDLARRGLISDELAREEVRRLDFYEVRLS